MLRSNEVSQVVRVCREDSPPGNESDRIVWREDSYILLQCPSREDPGDCNITGQKISRLDLEKYNKVKLLQGSDDQTDKNVIPFTDAAQNAPLLQEPLYCTNITAFFCVNAASVSIRKKKSSGTQGTLRQKYC